MRMVVNQRECSVSLPQTWGSQLTNYDTAEDVLVEAGQVGISRLASVIPDILLLPAMSRILSKYATQAPWKPRHAALLAIVQSGDHLETDHIQQLMPYILSSLQDSSIRIQWAAAQAASQACAPSPKEEDGVQYCMFHILRLLYLTAAVVVLLM